jgi:CubicO group peptidase (beta-lactamase class C family)
MEASVVAKVERSITYLRSLKSEPEAFLGAPMRTSRVLAVALLAPALAAVPAARRTDDLDQFIHAEMAKRQIPGLSLAVIQDGKIAEARAYGVVESGGSSAVTTTTLFQAGSISKPVAATAALQLVEQGKLSLDGNVNDILTSWKVPDNRFTVGKPVTLAGILSHTAGLTVHGFPGYEVGGPVATLAQVFDGTGPANTAPIRVDTFPGSTWRYSGGGYTVMQQMVVDLTRRPYPEFMRESVLQPLGMTSSTFEQPLPTPLAELTAGGHHGDRSRVEGRWHIYPEMAAAGLWTTASDLARFAIGIQRNLAGASRSVLSPEMARRMITERMGGMGLGLALVGSGRSLFFGHNGRDEGFDAMLTASAETGQGLVVMINANDNSRMMRRISGFVAKKYRWPDAIPPLPFVVRETSVTPGMIRAVAGRYEFQNNNMITLLASDTALITLADGLPDEVLVAVDAGQFASPTWAARFTPVKDPNGAVTGLRWAQNGVERIIPRVGPLVEALRPSADPDPAFTSTVPAILEALRIGGDAVKQSAHLTPGARRDFLGGAGGQLEGILGLNYLGAERVAGRGIVRHEGSVAVIAYYSMTTKSGKHYLMLHRTADGLVTDYDLVDN